MTGFSTMAAPTGRSVTYGGNTRSGRLEFFSFFPFVDGVDGTRFYFMEYSDGIQQYLMVFSWSSDSILVYPGILMQFSRIQSEYH